LIQETKMVEENRSGTPKERTAMPVVAGGLMIADGALKLLGLMVLLFAGIFLIVPQSVAGIDFPFVGGGILLVVALPLVILAVLAILGGISAIGRKKFWLSLTGAIASFIPFSLLGLAAIILLAVSRQEFED